MSVCPCVRASISSFSVHETNALKPCVFESFSRKYEIDVSVLEIFARCLRIGDGCVLLCEGCCNAGLPLSCLELV